MPSRLFQSTLENPKTIEQNNYTLILLSAQKNYWAKFVYQYSHEYMHYLVNRNFDSIDPYGWFEESLCELASLYVLNRLADADFEKDYLQSYKKSFGDYIVLTIPAQPNDIDENINEFIVANEDYFRQERYDRPKNMKVSLSLFPLFLEYPGLWDCVSHLPQIDEEQCETFEQYVLAWESKIDEEQKEEFQLLKAKLLVK